MKLFIIGLMMLFIQKHGGENIFKAPIGYTQQGLSTHYGTGLSNGHTYGAAGVLVDHRTPVYAHDSLMFGTIFRITNIDERTPNIGAFEYGIIVDNGPHANGAFLDAQRDPLWRLAGKQQVGGLRVEIEVVNNCYVCSTFQCLVKKEKGKKFQPIKIDMGRLQKMMAAKNTLNNCGVE